MAEAENAASDRRVSYEGHMAKAKQDAGGMKVSLTLILLQKRAIPSHMATFHACMWLLAISIFCPTFYLRSPSISSPWKAPTSRPVQW